MYKFYHTTGSCSLAVKAALTLTGAPFETQLIDLANGEHMQDAYKRISPLSKVPALAMSLEDNSEVLTEGAAILLFLANKYPDAELMPDRSSPEYIQALKWLQMLYASVHPYWSLAFAPQRYGNDSDSIHAAAEENLHKLYKLIDKQLAEHRYIAGDKLTLGDLYLTVTLHWAQVLSTSITASCPHIADYLQRMYQEENIGALYRQEFAG